MVLPWETVDAMRFFADIEVAAYTFMHQQPIDGQDISMEKKSTTWAAWLCVKISLMNPEIVA